MARILEEETGKGAFPAVLHCFTGSRELAERAIALGLFISFTGILTFKKSDDLRSIAKSLPAGRVLVETDAPPCPRPLSRQAQRAGLRDRDRQVLAETRGVSLDEIARETNAGFFRLFSKVPRPEADADKFMQAVPA